MPREGDRRTSGGSSQTYSGGSWKGSGRSSRSSGFSFAETPTSEAAERKYGSSPSGSGQKPSEQTKKPKKESDKFSFAQTPTSEAAEKKYGSSGKSTSAPKYAPAPVSQSYYETLSEHQKLAAHRGEPTQTQTPKKVGLATGLAFARAASDETKAPSYAPAPLTQEYYKSLSEKEKQAAHRGESVAEFKPKEKPKSFLGGAWEKATGATRFVVFPEFLFGEYEEGKISPTIKRAERDIRGSGSGPRVMNIARNVTAAVTSGAIEETYKDPLKPIAIFSVALGLGAVLPTVITSFAATRVGQKAVQIAAQYPKTAAVLGAGVKYGPPAVYGYQVTQEARAAPSGYEALKVVSGRVATEALPAYLGFKAGGKLAKKISQQKPSKSVRLGFEEVERGPVTIEQGGIKVTYKDGMRAKSLHAVETRRPGLFKTKTSTEYVYTQTQAYQTTIAGKPVTVGQAKSVILKPEGKGFQTFKADVDFLSTKGAIPKTSVSIQRGQVSELGRLVPSKGTLDFMKPSKAPLVSDISSVGVGREISGFPRPVPGLKGVSARAPFNLPKGQRVIADISKTISIPRTVGAVPTKTLGAGLTRQAIVSPPSVGDMFVQRASLPSGPSIPAVGLATTSIISTPKTPSIPKARTKGVFTAPSFGGVERQKTRQITQTSATFKAPRAKERDIFQQVTIPRTAQKTRLTQRTRTLEKTRLKDFEIPAYSFKGMQRGATKAGVLPATMVKTGILSAMMPMQAMGTLTGGTLVTVAPTVAPVPTTFPTFLLPPPAIPLGTKGARIGKKRKSFLGDEPRQYRTDVFSRLFSIKASPTKQSLGGLGTGLEQRPIILASPLTRRRRKKKRKR